MPKGQTSVKLSLDDIKDDEVLTIMSRLSLVLESFKKDINTFGVMLDVRYLICAIERKAKINLADTLNREKDLANKLQVVLPDLWDMYRKTKSPMEMTIDQFDTLETFALVWLYGFKEQVKAVEAHPLPETDTMEAYKRLVHAALLRLMEKAPYEREFIIPTRKYMHACDNTYWRGCEREIPVLNEILS